jgi:hypothetical protein
MKYTHFRRVSVIKDKQARIEISRAHTMVALLSLLSILLLTMLFMAVSLPTVLVALAIVLLALVALFSIGISLMARK